MGKMELQSLQEEDETLTEPRRAIKDGVTLHGRQYYWRDGVMYCCKGTGKKLRWY